MVWLLLCGEELEMTVKNNWRRRGECIQMMFGEGLFRYGEGEALKLENG